MKIAVDAMGGDYAPGEIVKGAAQAVEMFDLEVVLVGDQGAIKAHLPRSYDTGRISIVHTTETIEMGEHAAVVRTKKDASVVVAADLVRNGKADAVISVGNTAAAMAVATFKLGRIEGIDRPAIAALLPHKNGHMILLDAGAVVDCSPQQLLQFAMMGSIYAEHVMGVSSPVVGLLSVGEEPSKGNEVTKAAHELLKHNECGISFYGNVEGRELFSGNANVVVADGFAGNIALKSAEGLGEYVMGLLKEELGSHFLIRIPLLFLIPSIKRLKKKIDYSEYGGAPLLGLNGICIIGHGRSNAKAVANAVKAAKEAVEGKVVDRIRTRLSAASPASAGAAG